MYILTKCIYNPRRQYIHPTVYSVYPSIPTFLPFTLHAIRFLFTYRRGHMHRLHMYADRDGMGAEVRENGKNNKEH